jgi:hypothetical protein
VVLASLPGADDDQRVTARLRTAIGVEKQTPPIWVIRGGRIDVSKGLGITPDGSGGMEDAGRSGIRTSASRFIV